MQRESLDTNVLLRLMLKEIPEQYKKAKKLIETPMSEYFVSDVAIMECVYSLYKYYEMSRNEVVDVIRGLLSISNLVCRRNIIIPALALYENHPSLSFDDCFLAVEAGANEAIPLWTFDKKIGCSGGHGEATLKIIAKFFNLMSG